MSDHCPDGKDTEPKPDTEPKVDTEPKDDTEPKVGVTPENKPKPKRKRRSQQDEFEWLVRATGLSPIFARTMMMRALERVGVNTMKMTRADGLKALPSVRRVLEAFLPPTDVDARMHIINKLIARYRDDDDDEDEDVGDGGGGSGGGGSAPPAAHAFVQIPPALPPGYRRPNDD